MNLLKSDLDQSIMTKIKSSFYLFDFQMNNLKLNVEWRNFSFQKSFLDRRTNSTRRVNKTEQVSKNFIERKYFYSSEKVCKYYFKHLQKHIIKKENS